MADQEEQMLALQEPLQPDRAVWRVAQSTLSMITSGNSKSIQFDTIEKICIVLDIQPSELFAKCKKYETEKIK